MAWWTRLLFALLGVATLGTVALPSANPAWADTVVVPGPGTPIQTRSTRLIRVRRSTWPLVYIPRTCGSTLTAFTLWALARHGPGWLSHPAPLSFSA